ncbi:TraR/DksA C4-type zinc finger protein [Aeromonas hydrophila]|uniref:TraR/DksA C4-type zinc finger protein n=1 Tax=Aeromonas hydrophila TaxID=644 RepID=UPI001655B9E9|nr:TraR/DksA C4-type zinc finger protein [Aeromonas hydrophila]MBC8670824.1 TraR/DksA C4-type zinc finger protein [Aeromonas hydrophila]MBC8686524.1 TraR/DksA C4-type zinc finger protein [Aeromonas hydrophila]
MTDLFDRAQKQEQENRDRDLANQLARRRIETQDQDAAGNRFCLSCGEQIASDRLEAAPDAVRCVPCQSWCEHQGRHRHGV